MKHHHPLMSLVEQKQDTTDGVDIKSRSDVRLTSIAIKHFDYRTLVSLYSIRELLFADEFSLTAHSEEALQHLCGCFASAADRFSLIISIKKNEVLYQPACGNAYVQQ